MAEMIQSSISHRKAFIIALLLQGLLFLTNVNAQVSDITVDAGPDVTASCANPCVTLSANYTGTYQTSSYVVFPTPYTPYSFTTGRRIFVNVDDIWTNTISLPFNFCFFGSNYNQVVIGANGIISFNTTYSGAVCPWNLQGGTNSNPIPNPSLPLNSIMGIYQDIDPTNQGQVYWDTTGTWPNRRLIVSFYQVPYYGDPNSVSTGSCPNPLFATIQVVLHETTNVIDMYVQSKPFCPGWNGGRAIQGIQNATGTIAYSVPGRNNQQFSLTNDGMLFVPLGAGATSMRWMANGAQIGTSGTINVCPTVPTNYVLEVTYGTCNGNNVIVTDTVLVSPSSAFGGNVTLNSPLSCSSGATATASANGGTAPFTYLWSTGATTATVTGLAAGTFTVTVTESGGCVGVGQITITQPNAVSAAAGTQANVSCNGGSNGSLGVIASGGSAPYSYLWSNGATTATATNLIAGNYTVTVTDANGCTSAISGTITQPNAMAIPSITTSNVPCFGGSNGLATVNVNGGTSPYTYAWSSGGTNATANGLAAGSYTVTVTDSKGCTIQSTTNVSQPPQLQSAIAATGNTSCFGIADGSLSISGSGGVAPYQYLWSNGSINPTANGLAAGNYSVTITDANSCTVNLSNIPVAQPAAILISPIVQNIGCNSATTGSITTNVSAGTAPYQYLWNNGAITPNLTGIGVGTYTLTVTDNNGCTAQSTSSVTSPAPLQITSATVQNVSCYGYSNGSITLSMSGGTPPLNYVWSPNVSTGSVASNIAAGSYSYTVTDNNGCSVTGSSTVTQPAVVNASLVSSQNVSCNGGNNGSLTIAVNGGNPPFSYAWSPSGGNGVTGTSLSAGVYSVQITDINGCTFSLSNLNITEPSALTAQLNPTNVNCPGGTDGNVQTVISGGSVPYSYLWSNGATTANLANLPASSYTLTVTDVNGCSSSFPVTLSTPAAFASTSSFTPTACNGANGTATVNFTGGTPPYQYVWNNGSLSMPLQNVVAGTYTVTVTDVKGCTASITTAISALPVPTVSINGKDSICTATSVTLNAITQFAVAPVTYSWSGGATTSSASFTPTGNQVYSVIIKDANSCTAQASHTVTVQPAPLIAILDSSQFSCLPFGYTFSASVDIANCTYLWNFGDLATSSQVAPTHNWRTPGTFDITLTATSPVGCVTTVTKPDLITIYPFPDADFVVRPDILYDYQPTAYFQNVTVGGAQYWWDFGDGSPLDSAFSPQHTYADTGIYMVSLVAESENGCRDTAYGPVRYLLQSNIYIPMAFTPNNDGKNDMFAVLATELANFNIVVQNRWGQPVFSANSLTAPWDGTYNGVECPNGIYVYIIKYQSTNGKSGELTGRITLYR
jgi:gliding motility-associated-like protein